MTDLDRPFLHLTPPSGWMNDPNGMVFHEGRLHLFYQYEPDVPKWGRIRWGHAASRNLVTWEHLPIALEPDPDGADALGCWSGCLVTDDEAVPTIFYTAVVRDRGIRRASIARAVSEDGLRTWTKDPDGPVITRPPAGIRPDRFRDPFVYRDDEGWAMLVGAGTTRARGAVLLYRSDDLCSWRYVGPFLTTDAVVATDGDLAIADIDSPCWECPQLIRLNGTDVLIVSIVDRAPKIRPAHVLAFTGRVEADRFIVERTERLGLGPDFYAPATITTPDGRRLLFGWIPEDPPSHRSARTWAGSMTLPRVVSLDPEGRLQVTLAAEVERFEGPLHRLPDATVTDATPWVQRFDDGHFEFRLSVVPEGAASIRFDIAGEGGTVAEIRFEPGERRITVARTGRVLVAGRDPHGTAILPPTADDALHLRLILDGSVLELVADERQTATVRLPEVGGGSRTISCTTIGGTCRLTELDVSTFALPANRLGSAGTMIHTGGAPREAPAAFRRVDPRVRGRRTENAMDAQALIGMAVVALDDADRLGSIDELVFQTDPLRLTGLQVADPRGRFSVLLERIRSIGPDAVTVESREVADAGVLATGVDGRLSLADLKHLKVVDETGALVGEVLSIDVEPTDGTVISLNTIKGGLLGVGGTKLNLPPDTIRGIGAEVLTVKADSASSPAADPASSPPASDEPTA